MADDRDLLLEEMRDAVYREREQRYWTNTRRQQEWGDEWPRKTAEVQVAADEAVDAVLSAFRRDGDTE